VHCHSNESGDSLFLSCSHIIS